LHGLTDLLNRDKRGKRRSRRFRQRKRRRMPINVAASLVTTLALYCGVSSVFFAIRGEYESASYLIILAIVLDMLDGTVARMTNSTSDFGKELDSLADMVSFGIAPAVLIYSAYLVEGAEEHEFLAPAGSMVASVYVICAALRLARFNVFQAERQDLFVGLPSPAAAGNIAAFTLFCQYFDLHVAYWVLGPFTLALALLMVSTVRYPKKTMRAFVLAPRRAFRVLVMFVGAIAAVNYALHYNSPAIIFLPFGVLYVSFGLVNEGVARLTRRQSVRPEEAPPGDEHPQPGN
jgi:CDP-diacylglycerol--serine O-phosphatidyltransferase